MTTKLSTKRYELWKREDTLTPGEFEYMIWDTEKGGVFNWYYTAIDALDEFEGLSLNHNGKEPK